MTTWKSCKRIWPNSVNHYGCPAAEALVSWSASPQRPGRELRHFNKFSVNSHFSPTSTIFTGRQDLKLMQNKPSTNRNKNLDTNPSFSKRAHPRLVAKTYISETPSMRKPSHPRKGLTVSYHTWNSINAEACTSAFVFLCACIMVLYFFFTLNRWTDLATPLVNQKKIL